MQKINRLGGLYRQTTRWGIYDSNGISPTITASMGEGGGYVPMITVKPICLNSKGGRGRVQKQLSHTLTVSDSTQVVLCEGDKMEKDVDFRIRKLTPKECWRLMGFSDEDFEKAEKTNSNTQLYKQAGNSIVVDVLMRIFKEML